MATAIYEIVRVGGLGGSQRREVVFLRQDCNADLNAHAVFAALEGRAEMDVRSRMDYWIGGGTCETYFHGWPGHQVYGTCFVFKWKTLRVRQRMYGFLDNPLPRSNPAFQLCVLCSHDTKTQHETDRNLLEKAVALRNDPQVRSALAAAYPDTRALVRR